MSKITHEQIQKINNQCKNEWELDVQFFLFHNEKQLHKKITLDEENYLMFTLRYNYKNEIILNISKYKKEIGRGCAISEGLGKQTKIADKQARRNLNALIEYTEQLTTEKLNVINSNTRVIQSSVVMPSDEF